DHEALVVNHSITSGSSTGVRWYELRLANGVPSVFQQGTYAPDATYRWMGSIALDQAGNMGLGFSVSSSSLHPEIRYTGRLASVPLASGATGTSTISTAVTSGSAETVTLSVTGTPAGATATLSPGSVTAGGSSTLTIDAGTAAPGTYPLTIAGVALSATHATT